MDDCIKLNDLVDEIKSTKQISKKDIIRIINAFLKVIPKILLDGKEIKFSPFFKLSFRITKDRMAKSSITGEMVHIPQHLRFKSFFYNNFKRFINE